MSASTPRKGEPSIDVRGLTKFYGDVQAVRAINFQVQPGEIVGFLGPNGAGKTTTMKILTCFMSATDGTARVAGYDVLEDSEQVRKRIGYLPENVPLYEEMLVYDYLKFIAEIRGIPAARQRAQIKRVVELTGLTPVFNRGIWELSKGYRQRVGLAQAIIHEPDVVILDEPISGLDPNQIIEIRDVIKEIGQEKTVLFSTHIMQEVAAVCDRIVIINQGQIVADGTLHDLADELARTRPGLIVTFEPLEGGIETILRHIRTLESFEAVHTESGPDDAIQLRLTPTARASTETLRKDILGLASREDLPLKQLGPYRPNLEAVFRAFTEGTTEEGDASSAARPRSDEEE